MEFFITDKKLAAKISLRRLNFRVFIRTFLNQNSYTTRVIGAIRIYPYTDCNQRLQVYGFVSIFTEF